MIEIFIDSVKNYQFEIAKTLIQLRIPNRNFAILQLIVHYFEMIARYREGASGRDDAGVYFKKGLDHVFPNFLDKSGNPLDDNKPETSDIKQTIFDYFYSHVRCGLSHAGITKSNVSLSGDIRESISVNTNTEPPLIWINPEILLRIIEINFDNYAKELREGKNIDIRKNFIKKFSYDRGLV